MSDSIHGEITEYIKNLDEMETSVRAAKARLETNSLLQTEANLVLRNISSLRTEISAPNFAASVNLDKIVEISDNVQDISLIASRIVGRAN